MSDQTNQPPPELNITPTEWANTPESVRAFLLSLIDHADGMEGELATNLDSPSFRHLFDEVRKLATTFKAQEDRHWLILATFMQLHRNHFAIGLSELLDAIHLLQNPRFSETEAKLKVTLQLLWCDSREDEHKFNHIWQHTLPAMSKREKQADELLKSGDKDKTLKDEKITNGPTVGQEKRETAVTSSPRTHDTDLEWNILPLSAPSISTDPPDLSSDWPITRRQLIYYWRYLRHPVADGPADILDVKTTVAQTANRGYYFAPAYQRRTHNYAHLILLVDQDGSMMPFHRFTREIIETAHDESDIRQVDTFYFHDVPDLETIYSDSRLTQQVSTKTVFEHCTEDTSVLIISDVGAARGHLQIPRVQAFTEFLTTLRERTNRMALLNPMPKARWRSTTAEFITHLIPMFPITADGFSNAIDVVRGLMLNQEI